MNFKKTTIACSVAAMSLALISCGGDSGSQDSGSTSSTSFTGLVVDGRIANGLVWVDLFDNGAFEPQKGEPYAKTDDQGYYSYRPAIDGQAAINYCELKDSPFCLDTAKIQTSGVIKIAGGTDLDSGEQFPGVLSQKVTKKQAEDYASGKKVPMVSPLTSLGASLTDAQLVTLLTSLGISVTEATLDDVLDTDFSDRDNMSASDATAKQALFRAAYRIQKVTDSISVLLDAAINDASDLKLGETSDGGEGIKSTSEFVASALATFLKDNSTITLDTLSEANLKTIADNAFDAFTTKYAALDPKFDKTTVTGKVTLNTTNVSKVAKNVNTTVKDAVEKVTFTKTDSTATDAEKKAVEKAFKTAVVKAETVIAKTKSVAKVVAKGEASADAEITKIETTSTNVSSQTFEDSIGTKFDNATDIEKVVVDVGILSENLDSTDISNDSSAMDSSLEKSELTAAPASLWAGNYLSMSGKDGTEKGRVIFFFGGSAADAKGTVDVCYTFNSTKDADDQTGSMQGATWSKISDGVVQVTTTYGDFQVKAYRVEPVSTQTEKDQFLGLGTAGDPGTDNYGKFLFTSNAFDQDATWYSDYTGAATPTTSDDWGLRSFTSAPKSDSACKAFTGNGSEAILNKNVF